MNWTLLLWMTFSGIGFGASGVEAYNAYDDWRLLRGKADKAALKMAARLQLRNGIARALVFTLMLFAGAASQLLGVASSITADALVFMAFVLMYATVADLLDRRAFIKHPKEFSEHENPLTPIAQSKGTRAKS